ncbi:hypothetical protein [Amycolatopsis sp. cmx-4-83]|uniref:hypothetical protein n=1 Tax=Amycolatopsis sp. cmx-4-83 TaxID=2790940 RepID=UPI003979D683
MTYPPQPGQPGQPDPYGQQPQSGGFQQPYPQQGGWDPNQQHQPYPTQQYPQGWDPSQQQQQQGWDPNQQQGYPASPQPQWGDPNAQQQQSAWADPNAQQYGQQAWDPNQGGQMSGWDPATGGYAQGFGGPPAPPKKSKTGMWIAVGATVVVVLAALGVTGFVAPGFFLSKDDNTNVAAPPSSSTSAKPTSPKTTTPKKSTTPTSKAPTGSGASDAKAVLQGFIDKLNSGDKTGAIALGCADSKDLLGSWLDTFLKPPLKLELGEVPDDEYLVEGQVTGTSAGKNVKGTLSATNFDDKGFCVSTMLVS